MKMKCSDARLKSVGSSCEANETLNHITVLVLPTHVCVCSTLLCYCSSKFCRRIRDAIVGLATGLRDGRQRSDLQQGEWIFVFAAEPVSLLVKVYRQPEAHSPLLVPRLRAVELYLHPHICLYGIVLY